MLLDLDVMIHGHACVCVYVCVREHVLLDIFALCCVYAAPVLIKSVLRR